MPEDDFIPVKPLAWQEVFSLWRSGEAGLPRWIAHYTQKGFRSWDEWRSHTLKDLPVAQLSWNLYQISDPLRAIPSFLGGPFRPWIARYYNGADTISFSSLVKNPQLHNNPIVNGLLAHFPNETYLIGLRTKAGIVILEGMHRCCAFAVAAADRRPLECITYLALAGYAAPLPKLGSEDSPT